MVQQTLDSELRFTERHTTPKDERLLRELAKAIEGGSVESYTVSPLHILGAGLTGIAAIVSMEGCATIQVPQIVYPAGAPRIISDYKDLVNAAGQRRDVSHNGTDIEGRLGDPYGGRGEPALAAADGVALRSHWNNGAGNRIVIGHGQDSDGNYLRTLYIHLDERLVEAGDKVKRGQVIGKVGSTGSGITSGIPHLHFGVYRGPTEEHSNKWSDVNPHEYWIDGRYKITCFDPSKNYQNSPIRFTYPVPCKR